MGRAPETKSQPVPLAYLLRVCPTLASYSRAGIADWADVLQTAQLVRSMLGISPDAWARACETMGKLAASVVIAAILERSEAIRSPGGYLRALTGRAEQGRFSLLPMLSALERAGEGSDG
jgi:replication initiation protein RepC